MEGNLGDAVIYETLAQLGAPLPVCSAMSPALRVHARGLCEGSAPGAQDMFLSVGGDIFNNARPWLVSRRFLHNLRTLAQCNPQRTFLFGQSIPASCRGLARVSLARSLRRLSSVTVRDLQSLNSLRGLGVQAELSYDLAFAYQSSSSATAAGAALFEQAGVRADRCVLISVREFDAMYPGNRTVFLDRLTQLSRLLLARGHQPAVLIQAAAAGGDSDLAVARKLRTRVPRLAVLCPFSLGADHHPVDSVAGAIAQARGVVAVRYHTAVLRLLAGRQPFSLHYSNKGRDLATRLGLAGCPLESWDPASVLSDVESSFDLLHDPTPQRRHVREAFARQLHKAHGAAIPALVEPVCRAQPSSHISPGTHPCGGAWVSRGG